jgi:hypothetical protein
MRKRKSSFDEKQASKKRQSSSNNPFLQRRDDTRTTTTTSDDGDDILDHLISFTDLYCQKVENEMFYSHVESLIRFLQQEDVTAMSASSTSSSFLSPTDVAMALLPWTIRGVLSAQPEIKTHQWKTMKTVLNVSFSAFAESQSDDLKSTLTQSTLNKIIPIAATLATRSDISVESEIARNAEDCYCLLIDHLYRPTLDLVCQTLLPFIVVKEASSQMKKCTLQLMLSRLDKANPKHSFQLLLEPAVWNHLCLLVSQNEKDEVVLALLESILSCGFFHPEHHLAGYRSLTSLRIPRIISNKNKDKESSDKIKGDGEDDKGDPSKFRVYQHKLFEVLREYLIGNENGSVRSSINVPHMVPILIHCYLEQSKKSEITNDKNNRGRGRAKKQKDSEFTFRMVASLMAPLLLDESPALSDTIEYTRTKALKDCLLIMLQYDVYLPSNEDKDEEQFGFLFDVGTMIVGDGLSRSESEERKASTEELLTLEALLRLNHLVLHDRLARVFLYLFHLGPSMFCLQEFSVFFSSTVGIYQQLRQLDHFVVTFMNTVKDMSEDQDNSQKIEEVVKFFMNSYDFAENLGRAVKECPIFQLEEMIHNLDEWISKRCSGKHTNSGDDSLLALVVHLFSIISRYARVDKSSYKGLKLKAEWVMQNSVQVLLEASNSRSKGQGQIKNGLKLCGWVIDLETRCNFWVGSETLSVENVQSYLPAQVLEMIAETVKQLNLLSKPKKQSKEIPHIVELQFLACHRIHQLRSIIFEKQRIELSTGECYHSTKDVEEAKDLTAFAVNAARQIESGNLSEDNACGWKILTETLSAWTPYCDITHITSFLSWFFIAFSNADLSSSEVRPETAVAHTLVKDASFFEIPQVASAFTLTGLRCAMDLLKGTLPTLEALPESRDLDLQKIYKSVVEIASKVNLAPSLESKENLVRTIQAERILKLLNSVPELSDDASSSVQFALSSTLQLNAILESSNLTKTNTNILSLFCTNKSTISSYFKNLSHSIKSKTILLRHVEVLRKLLSTSLRMSISILEDSMELDSNHRQKLASSTSTMIASMVELCCAEVDLVDELSQSVSEIFRSRSKILSETETFAYSIVGKTIALVMRQHAKSNEGEGMQDYLVQPVKQLADSLYESAFHYVLDGTKCGSPTEESSLLFIAELLRFAARTNRYSFFFSKDQKKTLEELCLSRLWSLKHESTQEKNHALQYLTATISIVNPNPSFRDSLLDLVLEYSQTSSNILEPAMASITVVMTAPELRNILYKIQVGRTTPSQQLTRLRLFRLILVANAEREDMADTISQVAPSFYFDALQLGGEYFRETISVITEVASNKQFITLENCDIALLLGHISTVLTSDPDGRAITFEPISADTYKDVFTLLSFLLQRFSKQLYVCVPSIVCTLSALLKHNLHGDLNELDIMDRGQKFSRLCELLVPHKEVYKKHVLGILVEFVHALSNDLDLPRKNSLTPAVYCILDMLQQYETKQLNTMLDTTGRALFRSVYHSYQKIHVYKGQ